MGRVVLVTGVAADLARRYARHLAEHGGVSRVIGVDVVPPRGDSGDTDFVRADIRNPVIAKVLVREHVDTVVHLSVTPGGDAPGGRSAAKERNVIGTMQLLAACQQAPGLRHLVVKSSAAVYGCSSRDPAVFREDMSAKRQPSAGFARDVTEVESYVRGFARRRPDVRVAMIRNADPVGPHVRSPFTAYFRLRVLPTVLGHDARLCLVHEDDLLAAITTATLGDAYGTFNVAGEGVLKLSQAIRRLGRPSVPVPAFALNTLGPAARSAHLFDFSPGLVEYLTYGRGLDTTRMRTELGHRPRFSTAEAFGDFATTTGAGRG